MINNKNYRKLYIFILSLSMHFSSSAGELFKCKNADGETVITDQSCKKGRTLDHLKYKDKPKKKLASMKFGDQLNAWIIVNNEKLNTTIPSSLSKSIRIREDFTSLGTSFRLIYGSNSHADKSICLTDSAFSADISIKLSAAKNLYNYKLIIEDDTFIPDYNISYTDSHSSDKVVLFTDSCIDADLTVYVDDNVMRINHPLIVVILHTIGVFHYSNFNNKYFRSQ